MPKCNVKSCQFYSPNLSPPVARVGLVCRTAYLLPFIACNSGEAEHFCMLSLTSLAGATMRTRQAFNFLSPMSSLPPSY